MSQLELDPITTKPKTALAIKQEAYILSDLKHLVPYQIVIGFITQRKPPKHRDCRLSSSQFVAQFKLGAVQSAFLLRGLMALSAGEPE